MVMLGGAAMSFLYACGLDSSGVNAAGEPGAAGASTGMATGTSTGGAGGDATTATGGMGGAGGSGGGAGGAGGNGGAGGVTDYVWAATNPTQNAGGAGGSGGADGGAPSPCAKYTYTLPDWLKLDSPHTLKSSQTSESSLCVGFGVDEPRARNVSAGPDPLKWGLSIESERTNNVLHSDSWNVGWSANGNPTIDMDIQTGVDDPAGGKNATKFSSNGQEHSRYIAVNARVVSAWLKGEGFAGAGCYKPGSDGKPSLVPEACYSHFSQQDATLLYQNVTLQQWRRLSIVHPTNANDVIALETRNVPEGAGAILTQSVTVAYAAQGEQVGAYPTSYIPTAGSPVTRAGEKLFSDDTDKLCPDGFMNVTLKFAPNFSMSSSLKEQNSNEYHLLYLDDKTRLFLDRDERKLFLKIDNVIALSDALDFAREQELTITVEHKAGAAIQLTVAGASAGNGTYSGTPAKPFDTKLPLFILSKDTGAEESGDLRLINFD
jgi:hypothetical protein